MDFVSSSTAKKTTLTIPSPQKEKKNNLKSTWRISQYIIWGTVFKMESNYSIGYFQWFSCRTINAILMISIPLKVYGTITPESPLNATVTPCKYTSVLPCPQRERNDIKQRQTSISCPICLALLSPSESGRQPTKVHPSFLKAEHTHVLLSLTHCFSS